jgi:hypothetical protein
LQAASVSNKSVAHCLNMPSFFSVGVKDFPQISHPGRNSVPVTDPGANAGECRYNTAHPQSHSSEHLTVFLVMNYDLQIETAIWKKHYETQMRG